VSANRRPIPVALLRLPDGFVRYPNPSSDSALEGTLHVDLGEWVIDGKKERVVLRVYGEELRQLVEAIATAKGRAKRYSGGAMEVFVSAGPWPAV
jgi:hypothetical protein